MPVEPKGLPSGEPKRITMVLDCFHGAADADRSDATLRIMLDALQKHDELYLRAHPECPDLYDSGVRYVEEPDGAEDWQDIPTCMRLGFGDCLPLDTLVLRDDLTFAPLGLLRPGDRIMGDGGFTTVLDCAVTGEKPLLAFDLDNGCTLRCSPEHRVFLRTGEEVRAEDVRVGQRLKAPTDPFRCSDVPWHPDPRLSSTDLAWLTATHVADGWVERDGSRFSLSGCDVNPKRRKIEQKDRAAALLEAAGIHTRRAQKYLAVHDRQLAELMASCGHRSWRKHLPSLALTREQVLAVVEGLQTDSSTAAKSGAITYGTTSRTLALQTRVLHRMLGQSVHIRRWDEHGGLGEHPIYRVTLRRGPDADTVRTWRTRYEHMLDSVGVRAVREIEPAICGDVTTDSGRFYLPESDLVVHNCEDLACWLAAELVVRHGIDARADFTKQVLADGRTLYHIVVRLPDGVNLPDGRTTFSVGGQSFTMDPSRQCGMV